MSNLSITKSPRHSRRSQDEDVSGSAEATVEDMLCDVECNADPKSLGTSTFSSPSRSRSDLFVFGFQEASYGKVNLI